MNKLHRWGGNNQLGFHYSLEYCLNCGVRRTDQTENQICSNRFPSLSLEEALKHIGERNEKDDEERKATWLKEERF